MPATRVAIIGAALDLGAGRRGVDMGPSAIRYAGLSERLERAGIEVEDRGNVQAPLAETRETGTDNARFLDEILETCTRVAVEVEAARGDGLLPLVLGGDHSIAMGSLSGLAASGTGRRAVAGRPRRPEHARDDAVGERPRDAARRRARAL